MRLSQKVERKTLVETNKLFYKNASNAVHEQEVTFRKFLIFLFIAVIQWVTNTNILNNQVTSYGQTCSTRYNFCIGTVFSSCILVPMLLQITKVFIELWHTKWHCDILTFLKFLAVFSELGLTIMSVWSSFIIVSSSETIFDIVLNCSAVSVIRQLDETILQFIGVPLKNNEVRDSRLTETLHLDIEEHSEWYWFPEVWYLGLSVVVYVCNLMAWLECYDYFS